MHLLYKPNKWVVNFEFIEGLSVRNGYGNNLRPGILIDYMRDDTAQYISYESLQIASQVLNKIVDESTTTKVINIDDCLESINKENENV